MDPLTIALAIYGGYQGYKSSKKAGANTAGRILGTALGAYGGYNLGSGITSSALGQQYLPSVLTQPVTPGISEMLASGINAFNPAVTDVATTAVTDGLTTAAIDGGKGIAAFNPYAGIDDLSQVGVFQQMPSVSPSVSAPFKMDYTGIDDLSQVGIRAPSVAPSAPFRMDTTGIDDLGQVGQRPDYYTGKKPSSFLDQATQKGKDAYSYLFEKTDPKTGEKVLDVGKTALFGVPALAYASGAFETEPYERSMFTYNVGYPELYRSRKFYTQDPKTGEVKELPQQDYIPEESAAASVTKPGDRFGPYKRETITLQQGGLATLNHFKDGGVTYLPSKTIHDEDDEDNYMRTNGYVEDDAGNGDKEEDTMLAQLADGEFVTRTDGVLGAGILAGANPKNAKEMRKLGAEFFYEQQKRFKRIYDLLDASRKATAH
jgi:hypothetical protein